MDMEKRYALIHWEDHVRYIVACDRIVAPRKDPWLYEEGEYITAKYYGVPYRAVISQIHEDKQILTERKKECYPMKHSYDPTQDPKPNLQPVTNQAQSMSNHGADKMSENGPKSKRKEAKPPSQTQKQVAKPPSQTQKQVAKPPSQTQKQLAKPPSQAQTRKRAYIAMMGCESDSDDGSEQDMPVMNEKGHPSVAQKQPRRACAPTTPCEIQELVPVSTFDPVTEVPAPFQAEVPAPSPVSLTPIPAQGHEETMQCLSCLMMAARIKFLEEQLQALRSETGSPSLSTSVVPRPGVYTDVKARENKMERLIDGHQVFLYRHQKEGAIKKGEGEKRDGRKIVRYLMPIFFSRAERLGGTIAMKSENGQLKKLNESVIEAILDFSTANSITTRGNCRDAMGNQLSSMRANEKKPKKVIV